MPPCGHVFDVARRKKYEPRRITKTIDSVAISVTMPHHDVE